MKRFLDYINLPRIIKQYFMIKKMEKYSNRNSNSFWVHLLDVLIVLLFALTFYYTFFINQDSYLKIAEIVALVAFAVFFIVRIFLLVSGHEKKYKGMEMLLLIDDDGQSVKTWNLKGKTSLLIGKSSKQNEVDIDLSDTEYGSLVSRQHAVLNLSGDDWYVEDIDSANGCGMKKANENLKTKLEKGKPYKLSSGDIIYIANTKLLIK